MTLSVFTFSGCEELKLPEVVYSYNADLSDSSPLEDAKLERKKAYIFLQGGGEFSSVHFQCCITANSSATIVKNVTKAPFFIDVDFSQIEGGENEVKVSAKRVSGQSVYLNSKFIVNEKADKRVVEAIFFDDFETGDTLKSNDDGFIWKSMNRTSIVRDDNYVVYNNSPIMNGPIADRDWRPLSGSHSMRFRYKKGKYMAEQRFGIGKAYKEVWLKFALRVPYNFKHGSRNPSNNKLLAMYMDGYSQKGGGSTVVWEFWNDGSGGSKLAFHYSQGEVGGRSTGHKQHAPFISYPYDQGRWMELVFRLRTNSSTNSNDGIIELYRKWKGDKKFQKLHELHTANLNLPRTGEQGWAHGYLMGWSNPSYAENTEWLLDDFAISDTSLLE